MIEKIIVGLVSVAVCTCLIPVFALVFIGKFFNKLMSDD